MTGAAAITVVLPIAIIWLLVDATLREPGRMPPPLALRLATAGGLGLGIASCAYFVALVLQGGSLASVALLDGALAAASVALWWMRRSDRHVRVPSPPWSGLDRWLLALCLIWAAASAALFTAVTLAQPVGNMDAWLTWNARARFFFRAGGAWRRSLEGYDNHPDYPLLLPSAVAHGWRWLGDSEQAVPILIAAVFTGATYLLLGGTVASLRGRTAGLLAALCLLATCGFVARGTWLYADIPLSYFFLASLALLAYWEVRAAPQVGALVWAGLACGCAAWTKNEGLVFLLAIAAVRLPALLRREQRDWRAVGAFALGAAPPLALVAFFKISVAARNDIFADQVLGDFLARAADPARLLEIAGFLTTMLINSRSAWLLLALPLFVVLMGRTPDTPARAAAGHVVAVVGLVAAAYGTVYAITPYEARWHLSTSLDRVLFHLWPSALLAIFLWTASPAECAEGQRRPAS